MLNKVLNEELSVKELIEAVSHREFVDFVHYLLKKDEVPVEVKYTNLMKVIDLYDKLPYELENVVLVTLFQHYENDKTFTLLKKNYEKVGKYKEVIQLIDYYIPLVENVDFQISLNKEIALFYKNILLEPSTALEYFNRVLSITPDDKEVLEHIEDISLAQDNWEKILESFEERVNAENDPILKTMINVNITKIHLNNSNNIFKAKVHLKEAVKSYPKNEDIPLLLRRAFIDYNDIDEIIDFLVELFKETTDEEYRLTYSELLKFLFSDNRVVKKKGFSVYKNLVFLEPTNKEIFLNAVEYATENSKYEEFLEMTEELLKMRMPKEYQLFLINFLAEFSYEYLGDIEKAEKFAKQSQRLDPKNFKFDYIYFEFYKFTGNTRKVIEILNKKLFSIKEPIDKIEIYQEIAAVAESTNNAFKAIDSYKSILKIDPSNRLANDSLKRIYRAGAKWRALTGMLKDEIKVLEKNEEKADSVSLYEELIEVTINELKQDPTTLYKSLLAVAPSNIQAFSYLLEKNEKMKRWNEVIKIINTRANSISNKFEKIELYFQITNIYNDNLKKALEATVYYEKILELEPNNGDALSQLKETYEKSKKFDKLYDVLFREVDLSESDDSKVILLEELYAFTQEHLKKDTERLSDILSKILVIDQVNIFAIKNTLVLAENSNNFELQYEMLLKLNSLDENSETLLKLSKVCEKLNKDDEAIEFYQTYLQENSEDESVINSLVALYMKNSKFDEIDSLFESNQNWSLYYTATLEIIEKTEDRKKEYALKAIRISEEFLDDRNKRLSSLVYYNDSFKDDSGIIERIQDIYREMKDYKLLIDVTNQKFKLSEEKDIHFDIYNELTEIYIESKQYTELIKNEKEKFIINNDFSILDNLISLLNRDEDNRLLIEMITELLERDNEDYVKEGLYKRVIKLYNETEEYEKSKNIYFKLLELNKKEKYIDELIELTTLLDDFSGLVKGYELKLEYLESEDKIKQLHEMVSITLKQLDDKNLAIKYLKQILDIKNDHIPAIDILLDVYQSENRYDEKIELLKKKIELDTDKEGVYCEIAKTYYFNKKDVTQFTMFLSKVFELNIKEENLEIGFSVFKETYFMPLGTLLSESYEKEKFYKEQKVLFELILSIPDLDKNIFSKYKSLLADLLEKQFDDYELSYKYKKELFLEDPSDNHLLNDLERISLKKDNFSDLISTLRKLKDSVNDKMVRISILARLGKIYGKHLNEPQTAQTLYNEILKEDSENLTILNSLEEIYTESENYDMLYDILIKKHVLLKTDKEKTINKIAMAKVTGFYFNKMDDAIEQLEMLLDIDDSNFDVHQAKKEFFTKQEKFDDVIETLEDMVTLDYATPEEYLEVLLELGDMYAKYRSPQKAFDHYIDIHDTLSEVIRGKIRDAIFILFDENKEMILNNKEKLIPFFTNRKLWTTLIKYYYYISEILETSAEKELIYREIYNIYKEYLDSKEDEYKLLLKILKHTQENQAIIDEISQLNMSNSSVIEELNKIAEEKENNWEIYEKISSIYFTLSDKENGELFKLKAFKSNPTNDRLFEELLESYKEKEEYSVVKSIYLARSEAENIDESDKISLLMEVASLETDFLDDEDASFKTYEKIYKINKSIDVLEQLEDSYQEKNRWDDLKSLYETAISLTDDIEEKQLLRNKIVDIHVNKFNDFEAATLILEDMLEVVPTNLENYDKLEKIYLHLEKYEKLDSLYKTKVAMIDVDDIKEDTLYKRVMNAKDKLNSIDLTLDTLQELVELNPYNERALLQLEAFSNDKNLIDKVAKILGPAYETANKWEELVELYEIMLEDSKDDNLDILAKLSDVYKNNLGMFEDSLEHSLRYFEINPYDEVMFENIEGLVSVTEKHEEFVKSIDKVLDRLEGEAKAELELKKAKQLELTESVDIDITETESVDVDIDVTETDSVDVDIDVTETESVDVDIDVTETDSDSVDVDLTETDTESVVIETVEEDSQKELRDALIYRLLLKKEEIAEFNIEDKSVVISTLFRLKEKEPSKLEWYDKLSSFLGELARYEELIDVLKEQLNYIDNEDEKLSILYKVSEIYKNNLEKLPETVETYKLIIKQDPLNGMVIDELEVIYESSNDKELKIEVMNILEDTYPKMSDWDKYVALLKDKLQYSKEEDRKDILVDIALKLEKELYAPDEAFEFYEKAFKLSPTKDIADMIFEITDDTGNFEQFVEIMEANINKIEDSELKERVGRKLGNIYFEFLNEPDACIEHFTQLSDYKTDLDILKKLEMIYQEKEDFKHLETVYKDLELVFEDNADKIENLKKLANIQEFELKNKEELIITHNKLVELEPTNLESLRKLEELHEDKEELKKVYKLMLEIELEEDDKEEILYKIATLYKDDAPEIAEGYYKTIIEENENKKEAYLELIKYYTQISNWENLATNYEQFIIEYGDDLEEEELIKFYDNLASVYYEEEKLNQPKKAIENYLNILSIDSQSLKSLVRLKELFKASDEYRSELFDIMKQLISALEQGNEDINGGYESTIIDEAKLLNITMKTELLNNYNEFEDLLIEDEEFSEMIELGIKHLELFPKDRDIILKLEKVYESQEMFDELLTILDEKLSITTESDDKIVIYEKIALVSMEKLGDPERSIEAYKAILEIKPNKLDAIEKLDDLYRRLENWEDLIPLLKLKLEATEEVKPVYLNIIRVYSENLGDFENAYKYILISLGHFKDDEDFLNILDEVGATSMEWEEYIENTDKVIELLSDNALKNRFKFKIAQVYRDELGENEKAISRYEGLLEELPENREILNNLENLYSQEANWEKLATILEKIILLEEDEDLKKDYFYKLGTHYEENLEDLTKSAATFERLIKEYKTEMDALEQLERLYLELDDKKSLVHIYNNKIELIDDTNGKIELWYQIEEIGKEIENVQLQIRAYEEVLKLDENNEESVIALEEELSKLEDWDRLIKDFDSLIERESNFKFELIYKKSKVLEEKLGNKEEAIKLYSSLVLDDEVEDKRAVRALINLYKESENSDKLIETYKLLLDREENKEDRVEYLNSLAKIYHDNNEIDEAQTYYEYSLGEENSNDLAINGLISIFESKGEWENLIDQLISVAASQEDERASELYYKAGNIYLEKLEDPDNAKNSFELAVNSKYDHKEAIYKLKDIAVASQEYEVVTNYLEELRGLTEDNDQLVLINNELGITLIEKLEEPGNAVYAFEASMEAKPNATAALNISNLYYNMEDYENLSELYNNHFDLIIENDRENREKHYYRKAFAYSNLGGDLNVIYESSIQAFKLNSTDYENLNLLYDISYKTENFDTLVKVSKQMLLHFFDRYEIVKLGDIYVKLGIAYSRLKNYDKSGQYFNKTLAIDEFNVNALKHAVESYKIGAQWPKVIEYLTKILKREDDQAEKEKIYFEMALIYKEHIKNPKKALSFFNKLIELNIRTRKIYDHMLEIYEEQEDSQNILKLIIQISKMETDQEKKEKLYYRIANLYHTVFKDAKKSLSYLMKILENNYENTKVLSIIEKLLEPLNAFKELEAIYGKILSNTTKNKKELRFYILEKLAIIYKDKFQDYKKAISVYEELMQLNPDNKKYQVILIDFYERIPEFYNKAIKLHKEMIKTDYNNFESHHSLVRLYNEQKQYDKAFCHVAFLSVKEEATGDESRFYEGYKPITISQPYQSLTSLLFEKYIYPKELLTDLNRIFAGFSGLIADFKKIKHVKKIKDINYKKDMLPAGTRFHNLSNSVMNSLGLVGNDIYVSSESRGLRIENTRPATIVVGRDLLTDRNDLEAAFFLSRHLFFVLPEFYLINISNSIGYDVFQLFNVILSLYIPSVSIDPSLAKLQKYLMKHAPADAGALIEQLSRKGSIDLAKWLNSVELASNRVALLLSGDISRALKALTEDKHSFSKLRLDKKIDDLLRFSTSDKYLELRESLGITIKVK